MLRRQVPRTGDAGLDRQLGQMQQDVDRVARATTTPLTAGRLVHVPAKSAGTFSVSHGLGRKPSGWLVAGVDMPAAATGEVSIYHRDGARIDDRVLSLYATEAFDSLRLWVF
jgi:hypothetical protein